MPALWRRGHEAQASAVSGSNSISCLSLPRLWLHWLQLWRKYPPQPPPLLQPTTPAHFFHHVFFTHLIFFFFFWFMCLLQFSPLQRSTSHICSTCPIPSASNVKSVFPWRTGASLINIYFLGKLSYINLFFFFLFLFFTNLIMQCEAWITVCYWEHRRCYTVTLNLSAWGTAAETSFHC